MSFDCLSDRKRSLNSYKFQKSFDEFYLFTNRSKMLETTVKQFKISNVWDFAKINSIPLEKLKNK